MNFTTLLTNFALAEEVDTMRLYFASLDSVQPPIAIRTFTPWFLKAVTFLYRPLSMSIQGSKTSINNVCAFNFVNEYIMCVHNDGSMSSGAIFPSPGRYHAQFS